MPSSIIAAIARDHLRIVRGNRRSNLQRARQQSVRRHDLVDQPPGERRRPASMKAPVSDICLARATPISRGSRCDRPQPGMTFTLTCVSAKRAVGRGDHHVAGQSASSNPPVTAAPLIAAITGLPQPTSAATGSFSGALCVSSKARPAPPPTSLRSSPAVKARSPRAGQHDGAHACVRAQPAEGGGQQAPQSPATTRSSSLVGSSSGSRPRRRCAISRGSLMRALIPQTAGAAP